MKRILIAEDEAVIRDFIVINLKRNGYEVSAGKKVKSADIARLKKSKK